MEARKKVLYLITKSNFGGAQRYVYDLATNLPKEKFEVTVAAGGDGHLFDLLEVAHVPVIAIPSLGRDVRLFSDGQAFLDILSIIRKEKPDVLHLNSSKIGILGAIAGRLCRVRRIIFTAHGWAFEEDRSFLARMFIKASAWLTILLAHETIAISEKMRAAIHALPGTRGIRVIHNGFVPFETRPRDVARHFLAEKGVPVDETLVGTLAELHPIKGLRYAIEAIALLRDKGIPISLVVFGEGDERAALEKFIRERNLERAVFLLGFFSDAPKYLSAFDIFTLPSLYEGLGYALLEAGAAQLPVVATRVGGIPEVIEDGISGMLVSPRNFAALARGFESLLNEPEKKTRYGMALHERVHTQFSCEKMLEQTSALY